MIGAFGYLLGRSARNRLLRQLRRLRQPRYVIALLLGVAYLWVVVVQQRPSGPTQAEHRGWIVLAGSLALLLAVAWAWIFAAERRVLAFSPAEVTFLFSAPVTRRDLVHFKLLRTQLVILFNTVLWTLLLSRERFGVSTWLRAASVWLILTTLSLHRLGASFVRTSLAEHGGAGARRRAVSLTVVAGFAIAGLTAAIGARPALSAGWNEGIGPFLSALAAAAEGPIPTALLAPFRLLVAPLAAASPEAWLRAMVPALGLLLAHYVWVVRADASFQEAAVEESLRRARRLAAGTRGQRRAVIRPRVGLPYRLRAHGPPAEAIFWKNLAGVARTGRPRAAASALAATGVLLGVLSFRQGHLAEIVATFAAMWAGFLVVIGPQWVRSDLRDDLQRLDLLRSYPLSGRSLVAAEVASSTVVLTALQLGVTSVVYLALLGNRAIEPGLDVRTAALLGAAVLLPAVNLLGLLIQNAAAVLLPSWVHLGAGRAGGVEALGQNMLALMAHLIVLAVTLVPPVALAGFAFWMLRPMAGWWALVPAVAGALGVVALEASAAISWLGREFERIDPVTALSP
ncbi:MAG TPA: putative ABC exporter domain-containing protein [Gemmatimonadales bacterium]|nr:putative ABC exporter domain-containing protein [Gemmatimonadales bacterium]